MASQCIDGFIKGSVGEGCNCEILLCILADHGKHVGMS